MSTTHDELLRELESLMNSGRISPGQTGVVWEAMKVISALASPRADAVPPDLEDAKEALAELFFQCARYERPSTDWRAALNEFCARFAQPTAAPQADHPAAVKEAEREALAQLILAAHNVIQAPGWHFGFMRTLEAKTIAAADAMRAALSSTPATVPQDVGVPEGWKLVPTSADMNARKYLEGKMGVDFLFGYEHWIAATPNPPTAQAMTLADAAKSFPNGPFGQPHIAQPEAGVQGGQTKRLTAEQSRKLLESADHLSGDGHFMDAKDADWTARWLRRHVNVNGIGSTPGTAQP